MTKPNLSVQPTQLLDIESYITRYDKLSLITLQRLLFLARHSPSKEVSKEGFRILERRLKSMGHTKLYSEVFGTAQDSGVAVASRGTEGGSGSDSAMDLDNTFGVSSSSGITSTTPAGDESSPKVSSANTSTASTFYNTPSEFGFQYDSHFVHTTEQNASYQLQTLEANLSTAQQNLSSKGSIREAFIALANFYRGQGMSSEAIIRLRHAQEYSSDRHQSDVTLSLAILCLEDQSYSMVQNFREINDKNPNDWVYDSKLKCARALGYLGQGKFHDAAVSLLGVKHVDFTQQLNSVLSAEDIALYGGLLGMIMLDREDIEKMVQIEAWRERLELVPFLRDAIRCYMRAEYGECLRLVDNLKGWIMLDLFLSPHVDTLWKMMRDKCIVQYFQPYMSLSLTTMKDEFGFDSVDELEDAVALLIESNRIIGARIDGVNRTLTGMSAPGLVQKKRNMLMKKIAFTGDKLIDEVEGMILRMSCLENNIIVQDKSSSYKSGRRGYTGGRFDANISSDEEDHDVHML